MRNWLLTTLLAVFAITLICCNQKEDLQTPQEGITNDPVQTELNELDGQRLYAETDEDGDMIVSLMSSEDSDAVAYGDDYCVYQVRSVNGNVNCPFFHLVGFEVCVNCPDDRPCPGTVGKKTNYRYLRNGVEMCRGQWILQNAECIECPRDGKKGFVFVN